MWKRLIERLGRERTGEATDEGGRSAPPGNDARLHAAVAALEGRVARLERIEARRLASRSRDGTRDGAGVAALREQVQGMLATGCSQAEAARRLGVTRQYVHRLIHPKT